MNNRKHLRHLLAQPSLHTMAACIGGLLLGWPVIQIAGEKGHWTLFLYVFTVWAALVVLLVCIGRAIARSAGSAGPHDSTSGPGPH